MNEAVRITWLGHSCFRMEYRGWSLVTDPYGDGSVPGLPPLRVSADAVYCSHGHADHGFTAGVTLSGRTPPADFRVDEAVCPHDDRGGALRGMSTIRRFRFGALSVVHAGDIGCAPQGDAAALLRRADLLLLPVGGYYTVDGAQAARIARESGARCVVPMHYREGDVGFPVISGPDGFLRALPAAVRLDGPLTLTEEAPRGVLVLSPRFV